MLLVVGCVLLCVAFEDYWSFVVGRCLLSAACCSQFVVRCLPYAVLCSWFAAWCSLSVACCMLRVVCCSLLGMLIVVCCL